MTIGSQNSFNHQQLSLTPGRVITKVKRYTSPSGQILELQCITTTIQDQGIWRTEETTEPSRPLDDGTTPNDCSEIRECLHCQSLIHVDNSCICPSCSQCYCLPCTENIRVNDRDIRVCLNCAKQLKTPVFLRFIKNVVWGQ